MANLTPCGGDVRQDRGGRERTRPWHPISFPGGDLNADKLAGQRPPLPFQASPPQGGRSAVTSAFANLQR
ncbi:MAG: hypothetical protein EOR72_05875 [Mesorhizobium sp.]|nr:MAG: hypothetical protein EOR72_05875 [Mesorhizobium sp.]